ncbi:MAG: CBS domain-containing protein [Pseudomonadota bacterium]
MPASYQAPMRKDQAASRTYSQSMASNTAADVSLVSDVLARKGNAVFTIGPEETLGAAVRVLGERGIGALVVTDEAGALRGILSERDIVRKLAETPGQTLPKKVGEIMTRDVKTCGPKEPLVSVLKTMSAGRFRHMPVVDGGKLVGMVTVGDVVHARLNELEQETLQLKQLIVG